MRSKNQQREQPVNKKNVISTCVRFKTVAVKVPKGVKVPLLRVAPRLSQMPGNGEGDASS